MNDNSPANSPALFKVYVESTNQNQLRDTANVESGRFGPDQDPYAMDVFSKEVDNAKEDIEQMEKLYNGLVESNEEMKAVSNAKTMMELRTRTNVDMDHVLKLARQINRKFDGFVRSNAAMRKLSGNGPGSVNDQGRGSMISGLGESLKEMMVRFQGLRVRMETDHRQVIESRYLSITGEKATEEAIENLVSNIDLENLLHQATQVHGKGTVLDSVAEIQERRDAMKEIRRNLMNLHQILLGMATPVEAHQPRGGGSANQVEFHLVAPPPTAAKAGGTKRLNDYEKETRNQAYIALSIALLASIFIIGMYLKYESKEEEDII